MTTKEPTPKLKAGVIYSADNGQRICLHCAGASAKYTGRDISGQRVHRMTKSDAYEWLSMMEEPLSCEAGCTTFVYERP